jgi:salicylate hydroxylase
VVIGPPALLTAAGPAGLHERACSLISAWDGGAQKAVAAAEVPDTFLIHIRCSPGVPEWPGGRVTFLGDAVHTMTPAGGEGANTAMRDAAALAAKLGLVQDGRLGLEPAIEDYEAELRAVGNAAIIRSQNYAAAP